MLLSHLPKTLISNCVWKAQRSWTLGLLKGLIGNQQYYRRQDKCGLVDVICYSAIAYFYNFLKFLLAETKRHPFDLPEAEAELVSGYNMEYSAMTFAIKIGHSLPNSNIPTGSYICNISLKHLKHAQIS